MSGHYSLHECVHDWVLENLIGESDTTLFGLAMRCVAQNVTSDSEPEFWWINGRLNHHALRIEQVTGRGTVDWNDMDSDDIYSIGYLDSMIGRRIEVEMMYIWALEGYEKARDVEHTSRLDTVNNLGSLYSNQSEIQEAEIYMQALKGYEKA